MVSHSDIVVVGGGPVGALFALALAQSGYSIQVLEARKNPRNSSMQRTLALSYGTRLVLERLGVWSALREVTSIQAIHISQRGSLGVTRLSASEESLPELGAVVDYRELDAALHQALARSEVSVVLDAKVVTAESTAQYAWVEFLQGNQTKYVSARLAVIADGGRGSEERIQRDYAQHALITWVKSELPHQHIAYERFTDEGPMALLPHQDGFAVVLTAAPERIEQLLQLSDQEFLSALYNHFGERVGRFMSVRARSSFPLNTSRVREIVKPHRVMIGNAAHIMHPVAGQGFNLGVRDAWTLAEHILHTPAQELGSMPMLQRYAAVRGVDVGASMWFTDQLVHAFNHPSAVVSHARSMGLMLLQQVPPLKHFVAQRMIFGARAW